MASEDWDAELLYGHGGADVDFDVEMLRSAVKSALDKITKPVETVLIVPPVRPPAAAVPRRCRDRGGRRGFYAHAECSNKLLLRQDFTRAHSQAGIVTKLVYDYYGSKVKDILPALGSHDPMSIPHTDKMFAGVPHDLFRVHDWRTDVVTLGTVPAEFVSEITGGKYSHEYLVQVNRMIAEGGYDLIISVGQVVPHEVAGMANHTKVTWP
jgi:hypothetical protein